MYLRREFLTTVLAAARLSALGKIDSKVNGVQLGLQTYSFRDRSIDDAIIAMSEIGLGECEVYEGHIEPRMPRELLRQWRLAVPLANFESIRKKFEDAGVTVYAYNLSILDDFTPEETDRAFEMARALGASIITASSTLSEAQRLVPFAEKHKMTVAFHGHSDVKDPNQFATPESFVQVVKLSKRFAINLDIGHFTAAGFDAVEFIQEHHDRIAVLHLKDRKKNRGDNVLWGQGDTPIKQVLRLAKEKRYPLRAYIEYEYRGGDPVLEVKKCFEYCKAALA
jgi:sugar phosphate isomerase/epimerase